LQTISIQDWWMVTFAVQRLKITSNCIKPTRYPQYHFGSVPLACICLFFFCEFVNKAERKQLLRTSVCHIGPNNPIASAVKNLEMLVLSPKQIQTSSFSLVSKWLMTSTSKQIRLLCMRVKGCQLYSCIPIQTLCLNCRGLLPPLNEWRLSTPILFMLPCPPDLGTVLRSCYMWPQRPFQVQGLRSVSNKSLTQNLPEMLKTSRVQDISSPSLERTPYWQYITIHYITLHSITFNNIHYTTNAITTYIINDISN
jgi:hypothetical protein